MVTQGCCELHAVMLYNELVAAHKVVRYQTEFSLSTVADSHALAIDKQQGAIIQVHLSEVCIQQLDRLF